MKAIFLDIDGVLNSYTTVLQNDKIKYSHPYVGAWMIADVYLYRLKKIISLTGAKIILHSTWRYFKRDRELVRRTLARANLSLYDYLPFSEKKGMMPKQKDIEDYLSDHSEINHFIVLDDESSAWNDERLVQTNLMTGLTKEKTNEAINKLNQFD